MKYIDEFRNLEIVKKILKSIEKLSTKKIVLMEVCGTHTVAIFRSGIKKLLPKSIKLISGPGCPVCVTSQTDIDKMIAISKDKNVIVSTFGDMVRVPGTSSSLEIEKSKGTDIRVVYSSMDAIKIANENKNKEVVFLGVGFETTAPTIACTIISAKENNLRNFSVFSSHKIVPPAMEALLTSEETSEEIKLNGFICPGHVSTIIGSRAYEFIPKKYGLSCVISGFEPLDILQSIEMILANSIPSVINQYTRCVKTNGNEIALKKLYQVFETTDSEWRGIGNIPKSGLKLKREFSRFDANLKFEIKGIKSCENKACRCGDVLKGIIDPLKCKLFAKKCTPENPIGPCMVSSEGTCSAHYKYGR
jgi:hydrogenase expression/formation protein HypD